MWTKRQLITQAYEEIGLASYVFDLTPEQLESARRRMDAMVAGWNANGARISYPLPSTADGSDLDQQCTIPDYAIEAVFVVVGGGISVGLHDAADGFSGFVFVQVVLCTISHRHTRQVPCFVG